MTDIYIAIAVIIAYLIGSISSAVLVCQAMRLPDPRTHGSNNPGATNVLRIGGKFPALLTFVGDILKGMIPVFVGQLLGFSPLVISFLLFAAFVGHLYPVFFGFKGGKGIATFFGGLMVLHWPLGLLVLLTWFIVALLTRYSSLAALLSSLLSLVYNLWIGLIAYYPALILMILFIYWRHRSNIKRLLAGTESRIGKKK
jgi:glycerol-3-phosphate acyltransferase PlsY